MRLWMELAVKIHSNALLSLGSLVRRVLTRGVYIMFTERRIFVNGGVDRQGFF